MTVIQVVDGEGCVTMMIAVTSIGKICVTMMQLLNGNVCVSVMHILLRKCVGLWRKLNRKC